MFLIVEFFVVVSFCVLVVDDQEKLRRQGKNNHAVSLRYTARQMRLKFFRQTLDNKTAANSSNIAELLKKKCVQRNFFFQYCLLDLLFARFVVAFKFNHVMRHLSLLHPVVCHHHLCK
jgi:hypothetical protein